MIPREKSFRGVVFRLVLLVSREGEGRLPTWRVVFPRVGTLGTEGVRVEVVP